MSKLEDEKAEKCVQELSVLSLSCTKLMTIFRDFEEVARQIADLSELIGDSQKAKEKQLEDKKTETCEQELFVLNTSYTQSIAIFRDLGEVARQLSDLSKLIGDAQIAKQKQLAGLMNEHGKKDA